MYSLSFKTRHVIDWPSVTILEAIKSVARWVPGWRIPIRRYFVSMASTDSDRVVAGPGTNPDAAAKPKPKPKLHGRAFYESIGSPKYVVAPMVDQSEFVCRYLLHIRPAIHA